MTDPTDYERALHHALRELDTLRTTLTAAQAASTRDLDAARAMRRILDVPPALARVIDNVVTERARQDRLHGAPDAEGQIRMPDGTGGAHLSGRATMARQACDEAFGSGCGTWRHILAEEVAEALAETDPARLRRELVEVAAVCIRWCEAMAARSK